jgi:hypothetical protein
MSAPFDPRVLLGQMLFSTLCRPTAPVTPNTVAARKTTPGLTMPKRQRTRTEHRRQRIDAERRLNTAEVRD